MNRVPPTLGMVGVDVGTKPAISLVIPRNRLLNQRQESFAPVAGDPCIHCETVDLWPEGDLPAGPVDPHPWKEYCLRQFVYDRASDGTLSGKRVFTVTFVVGEPVYTESSSWYDFDPAFVTGALGDLSEPPAGPCASSSDLQQRVHFFVNFYRERRFNLTPPPKWIPVGDETTSLPNVLQICYSYGIDVDELYGI